MSWHFVAREASRPEGLDRLLVGAADERSSEAVDSLTLISSRLGRLPVLRDEAAEIVETALDGGIGLTTVLDDDYPLNLRTIFNLPPFLFYRGTLRADDVVAASGCRRAARQRVARA